ncbi:hypothetical protein ES703_26355 [subsurface metagenome]
MRYWDSAALIPLFVQEADTEHRKIQLNEDPHGSLEQGDLELINNRLDRLSASWSETNATEKLRLRAIRLLGVHTLRAADALHLTAALIASEENPQILPFLCSDTQLISAAKKEGFKVLTRYCSIPPQIDERKNATGASGFLACVLF